MWQASRVGCERIVFRLAGAGRSPHQSGLMCVSHTTDGLAPETGDDLIVLCTDPSRMLPLCLLLAAWPRKPLQERPTCQRNTPCSAGSTDLVAWISEVSVPAPPLAEPVGHGPKNGPVTPVLSATPSVPLKQNRLDLSTDAPHDCCRRRCLPSWPIRRRPKLRTIPRWLSLLQLLSVARSERLTGPGGGAVAAAGFLFDG